MDYVWLTPVYQTPFCDGGYDISSYSDVDPRFGTIEELDEFIGVAHSKGIKVLMDLVLSHTSTEHPWFRYHPEYYCWSETDRPGWRNLFDQGSAWEPDKQGFWNGKLQYYLHLFQRGQADLNWFPNDELSQDLVDRFRSIVRSWIEHHHVDGFRLDIPQAINKDLSAEECELADLLYGDKAEQVLNAVFGGITDENGEKPFLVMECFDPSFLDLCEYYVENTPVDYCLDVMFKDVIEDGGPALWHNLKCCTGAHGFMLDLESHDSPRAPSRLGDDYLPQDIIQGMFRSRAQAICLYQGQELGLKNPTRLQMSDDLMLYLDAMTAMRHQSGESLEDLRPHSRANARMPLPLDLYESQMASPQSVFCFTRDTIKKWKNQ